MKILCEGIGWIPGRLDWRCQNREKSIVPRHILGIFEIFKGGKGTLDGKYGKFYYSTFHVLKNPVNFPQ
jgi:hypothetical protein